MTIEPSLLEQHLPEDTEKQIPVCHPGGQLAFYAIRRELTALAKEGMVSGMANKHGYLRYAVLRVPLYAALRIVRRFRRPPVDNSLSITRPVQNGMRWKQCASRAQNARSSRERFRWSFQRSGAAEVTSAFSEWTRSSGSASSVYRMPDGTVVRVPYV